MRIIYLPDAWVVVLCFIIWPFIQILAALICLNLPNNVFNQQSFFFKTHKFEREGQIYNILFGVSRWKHLLPDGGMVLKKHGFNKKHLENFSEATLTRFLIESARGELTHWLAIPPFWIFGLFGPPQIIWYMLIYALLVNIPCIIAQRYNRPRVLRLLKKIINDPPPRVKTLSANR